MLLVCSKSTRKFLPNFDRVKVISEASTTDILKLENSEENVVAIGGGAVIDTAKILSRNPIISYPTTASGSTATSWSVYWDGPKKHSLKRVKPQTPIFQEEFCRELPKNVINDTIIDVVSHCLDSDSSIKSNDESRSYTKEAIKLLNKGINKDVYRDVMEAGHLAGKAIEITGTNLLHSLSYPLTGHYKISHGTALGFILKYLAELYNIDFDFKKYINPIVDFTNVESFEQLSLKIKNIVDEAYTYDKIKESTLNIQSEEVTNKILNYAWIS